MNMQGTGSLFGLTPEQLSELQRQRQMQERQQRIAGLTQGFSTPGQQAMARIGAQAGQATRGLLGFDQGEDPDIAQARQLQSAMQEAQRTKGFSELDPLGQQELVFKNVARVANEINNPQLAMQAAERLSQITSQRSEARYNAQKRALELQKLGLDVGERTQKLLEEKETPWNELSWRTQAARSGSFVPAVVRVDGQQVPVSGQVDENGQLVVSEASNPQLAGQVFSPSQYMSTEVAKKLREVQDSTSPNDSFFQRKSAWLGSFNKDETRSWREEYRNYRRFSAGLNDALGGVFRQIERGQDPAQIIGTTGSFVQTFNNVFNTAKSTAGFLSDVLVGDEKINPNSDSFVKKFEDAIQVPEGVVGTEASRYKATVMRIVYMNARIQEPGARQLSDADIQRSMQSLGVNSATPQTLAATFFDNLQNASGQMNVLLDSLEGLGEGVLDREETQKAVFGVNVDDKVLRISDDFLESISGLASRGVLMGDQNEEPQDFTGFSIQR
jgi:hypothetical protein